MSRPTYQGRDATFTLDGVPFPIESAKVSYNEILGDVRDKLLPAFYEITGTMQVVGEACGRLLDLFVPRCRGASDATLARRVEYGGRKGRRALRRLQAKGFVGILNGES